MLGFLRQMRQRLAEILVEPPAGPWHETPDELLPDERIRPEQRRTLRYLAGAVLADPDDRRAARQFRDSLDAALGSEGPGAVVLPDGSIVAAGLDAFRPTLAVPVDRVVDLGAGEVFSPGD